MKVLIIASFFLSLLVFQQIQAIHGLDQLDNNGNAVSNNGYNQKIDCGGACAVRCSLSSRPRLCKRACGTCCTRCNCVPPGTSGNLEVCPCYATMKTRGTKRKCP